MYTEYTMYPRVLHVPHSTEYTMYPVVHREHRGSDSLSGIFAASCRGSAALRLCGSAALRLCGAAAG
ncbi:hypothetical protein EYF80_062211 [Liparis tanakae]|uniref:Uncharacterized protein n=1 Tax=Liparis tanakae TaxID=230148 RepID=A0A4Z2EFT9_9TELE|nr:hypothetical protein EYF80_062211 [Liparis tanakae]